MKLKYIKFKQTTTNKKCNLCNKILKGKEGYIGIKYRHKNFTLEEKTIRICIDCFFKVVKIIKKDMEDRKKKYNLLIKRNILRKLK